MKETNEYILFLDETKKTPTNPYFCLGGFLCSRKEYEDIIIKEIYNLKEKYNVSASIPLHYTDIKNAQNGYEFLKNNNQQRTNLMNGIVSILNSNNIITLGVYFEQSKFQNIFGKNFYNIAFFELLRNYSYFLNENKIYGSLCIESRTFTENAMLQNIYYSYLKNGNSYFDHDFASKYLTSISFSLKMDSCAGLELADFIPVAFMRKINGYPDKYALCKTVYSKLYKKESEYIKILGLRELN